MRKILSFLVIFVLCAGCKNYQADIDDYLSYWSTQAAIVRSGFDPAITVQTDTDTIQSIPSSSDVTVTFTVRNPKNFTFQLPRDAGAPTDIIVFPTGVASTMTGSPKQPNDYELTQGSYSQLTLTYKKEFLQKYEYGKKNIGPTITLYAKDGRKFSETFKLNVKANTPPPNLTYRAIGKTTTPDVDGKHYYVLFLEVPDMDTEINSSELLHKDIKYLSISEGSGSYTSIPLTVKANKSGFDISSAGGRLLGYSDAIALLSTEVKEEVTPDPLPASTEKWIIRIKTDVPVGGAVKQYRLRLQDEAGLLSEDELRASTSTNKVSPVTITVTSGSWTVTPKHGTNADPHEITYGPGVQNILLKAETATSGATVHYKLERNGLTVSESSGSTPLTIELPAVPNAVYKLTAWAEKEGFDNSQNVVVFYNSKGLEVSAAGPGAWQRLKDAVERAADGDVIIVNGTIQATSASDNFGDITVSKSITIRGKNGNPATDILDANKDTGGKSAHRIFNVTGGNLTMEGLTLTGGMAIASGVGTNIGGGIYVGVNSRAELKNCIITACKAARVGGGIYSEGELILDNCTIGGEQYYDGMDPAKPKGNTASSGGGVSSNQGNLTIIGGAVTYNTADGPGGGIAFGSNDRTATLKVTGTNISHNKAKETGGGIYLSAPGYSEKYVNATLQNVTVKNNELTSTAANDLTKGGGGIFFTNYTNGATLTIIGGSIEGNNARNFNGGGIYITTERDNYVNGTLTLKDGARISGNSAENGGGVAVNSAKLIIESGCTIGGDNASQGNTAKTSGGGISVGKKAECTIKEGVTIRHNRVTQGASTVNGGGGLHIYGTSSPADSGTVTITGTQEKPVRIEDNEARGSIGVGGGIANNGTITLTHVHISGCKAPDSAGLGGGIYVRRGACTLIDTKVTGCEASGAGGGVYVYKGGGEAGEFTMQSSTRIVPSANNDRGKNDIFLRDGACIKLSGGLTGKRSVGRITVPDTNYNASTKVLVDDITDGENYKKFTVTPGGSPVKNWYVGSNGALTTTQPTP